MSFELQSLADRLYDRFSTPVTITDADDRLVAFSVQPLDATDALRRESTLFKTLDERASYVHSIAGGARTYLRIPSNDSLGVLERVVVPLVLRGIVTGRVFLIDPGRRVNEKSLDEFASVFEAAAREIELNRMSRFHLQHLLRGLLGNDEDGRHLSEEGLQEVWPAASNGAFTVTVIEASQPSSLLGDVDWPGVLGQSCLFAEISGMVVVLAATTSLSENRLVSALHAVRTRYPDLGIAGSSGSVSSLAEARISYRQALRALPLVHKGIVPGHMVRWDGIGAWRSLLMLPPREARESIDPRVATMLLNEAPADLDLLQRFLERESDVSVLAAELHLHRTSLYARNRRLEAKYDLSWDDPNDRLSTVVGLRINQLMPAEQALRASTTDVETFSSDSHQGARSVARVEN